MRALIDTCVIIDALQKREPFWHEASEILFEAANNHFNGFITASSVSDIYYIMHRATHSDDATRQILGKLFVLFDVLDTSSMDCRHALTSELSDFEDAIMNETAIREEMDCIVTRNIKDYSKSRVTVYLPSDFLNIVKDEENKDML